MTSLKYKLEFMKGTNMKKLIEQLEKLTMNEINIDKVSSLVDKKQNQLNRIKGKLADRKRIQALVQQLPEADYYTFTDRAYFGKVGDYPAYADKVQYIRECLAMLEDRGVAGMPDCMAVKVDTEGFAGLFGIARDLGNEYEVTTYNVAEGEVLDEMAEEMSKIMQGNNKALEIVEKFISKEAAAQLQADAHLFMDNFYDEELGVTQNSFCDAYNALAEAKLNNAVCDYYEVEKIKLDLFAGLELEDIAWDTCSIGSKFKLENGDILEVTDMGEDRSDDHFESYIHFTLNGELQPEYSEGRFNRLNLKGYKLN